LNDHKEEVNNFIKGYKNEYKKLREDHANRQLTKSMLPFSEARANAYKVDWANYRIKEPSFLGTKVFEDFPIRELVNYIDWTPFFHSWEIKGRYPDVFENMTYGREARHLFDDANELLDSIIQNQWLTAKATIGLFPANSIGDDIEVYHFNKNSAKIEEDRSNVKYVLHHLRQQNKKADGLPNYCLADFIAPKNSGIKDYIGSFVVSAGFGTNELAKRYEDDQDDYRSILVKALADRLAEALAEKLHEVVRKELWGYEPNESLSNAQLIKEKYRGIRPAPGYPACPDHLEKKTLFDMLEIKNNINVELTESLAMYPAASVSGWYFSNPDSRYFAVNRILKDQVEDYAKRKGMPVKEIEQWLSPILGYETD
jgi:5-methyltetrahydrofolate--homocysteine methyltransferase